jgi:hypothetical protein
LAVGTEELGGFVLFILWGSEGDLVFDLILRMSFEEEVVLEGLLIFGWNDDWVTILDFGCVRGASGTKPDFAKVECENFIGLQWVFLYIDMTNIEN